MADPVRNLGTRAGRLGTYDADLERIGGSHLPLLGWYWLSVRPYDPASHRHPCAGTRQPDPSGREGERAAALLEHADALDQLLDDLDALPPL